MVEINILSAAILVQRRRYLLNPVGNNPSLCDHSSKPMVRFSRPSGNTNLIENDDWSFKGYTNLMREMENPSDEFRRKFEYYIATLDATDIMTIACQTSPKALKDLDT